MKSSTPGTRISLIIIASVLVLTVQTTWGQSFEQTLPSGFENNIGNGGTSYPFNTMNDTIFQWHYDTANFAASGPIMINEIYVRAQFPNLTVGSFFYTDMEITLIEASTDFAASDVDFADNIQRGEVVRSGSFTNTFQTSPNNGVVASWMPLGTQKSFLYDPTSGNDLIIQIKICGVTTKMGVNLDGAMNNLGSRRGHTFDCTALTSNFGNTNFVPITRIDYTPVLEQSLPSGELASNSSSSTGYPVFTTADQTWQWHYDNSEFVASGPITISQISLRANSSFATVNAFDFTSFEVRLIEASTGYQVGSHDPVFANNVLRQKIVRNGPWRAPATAPSGAPSSTWISMQLTNTFDFDPGDGNDLIVQIRSCAPVVSWGVSLDGVNGGPGTVGGNRYGHTSDCTALAQNFNNNEFVPVVKISYTEREINTFPHREDFDHWGANHQTRRTPPGWIQSTNNVGDWRFHNRSTSVGTASSDFTTHKTGVGFYLTTDDSYSSATETIESPIFNLSTLANPMATFWMYSYSTMGAQALDENDFNVHVKRHNPGGTTSTFYYQIPTVHVLRHDCWTKFAVDLSAFVGQRVSLVFVGTTDSTNGFYHDFAIDDFLVASKLPSEGGQPATTMGRLNINDSYNINGEHVYANAPGPYYATGKPAGEFTAVIQGSAAFQPTALWIGPLNISVATFGIFGQMDTGTPDTSGDGIPESIFVFGSGLNPTPSFLDLFFYTNAAGLMGLSLPLNPALPFGVLGTFQAAAADGVGGIFLTNAVVFEIVP